MVAASPPAGVSHGEPLRSTFEVLDTRDVEPLRPAWTGATAERSPSGTAHAADLVVRDGTIATSFVVFDQMQFVRRIGLLPPGGSAADRATQAASDAKTRLLAGGRSRRR